MNARYFHIALAISIFAAVFVRSDETFQNRPTQAEWDDIVALGTECLHGVNERCRATQFKTNPVACRITPPFARTSAAGWRLDQNLFDTADRHTKNLVPCYLDTNSGITNAPVFMTVTGLFSKLGVGNKTNEFTAVSCWTNSGRTNYWIYAYREAFKERYKVLGSLKCTADVTPPSMIHSSRREIYGGIGDLEITIYENMQNKTTAYGYQPDFEAEILGYPPNSRYSKDRRNWRSLGCKEDHVSISLEQAKHIFEILWYKGLNERPPPWIGTNVPLIINTNESDNSKAAGMGTFLFCHPGNYIGKGGSTYDSGHVKREPKSLAQASSQQADHQDRRNTDDSAASDANRRPGGGGSGGGGFGGFGGGFSGSSASGPTSAAALAASAKFTEKIFGWTWRGKVSAIYGTYVWTNFCVPTSVVCHIEVMCQPQTKGSFSVFSHDLALYTLSQNMTLRVEEVGWHYPRNFYITLNNKRFEESLGMTTSKYCVIPFRYLRKNTDGANTLSLIIGSDQLVPLAQPGSMPDWCEAPVSSHDYRSNLGSAGKAFCIWFDRSKMYVRRSWDFQYCTNKFW